MLSTLNPNKKQQRIENDDKDENPKKKRKVENKKKGRKNKEVANKTTVAYGRGNQTKAIGLVEDVGVYKQNEPKEGKNTFALLVHKPTTGNTSAIGCALRFSHDNAADADNGIVFGSPNYFHKRYKNSNKQYIVFLSESDKQINISSILPNSVYCNGPSCVGGEDWDDFMDNGTSFEKKEDAINYIKKHVTNIKKLSLYKEVLQDGFYCEEQIDFFDNHTMEYYIDFCEKIEDDGGSCDDDD